MSHRSRIAVATVLLALLSTGAVAVGAEPSGTITWGVHVTLATRWLDTAETDAEITPFMVMYALHDALVKPMPSGLNTASLAESWSMSKDGRTWEFVLRKGPRFHNGDPVTAEDVKFSSSATGARRRRSSRRESARCRWWTRAACAST